jgi:hypothetical protein
VETEICPNVPLSNAWPDHAKFANNARARLPHFQVPKNTNTMHSKPQHTSAGWAVAIFVHLECVVFRIFGNLKNLEILLMHFLQVWHVPLHALFVWGRMHDEACCVLRVCVCVCVCCVSVCCVCVCVCVCLLCVVPSTKAKTKIQL